MRRRFKRLIEEKKKGLLRKESLNLLLTQIDVSLKGLANGTGVNLENFEQNKNLNLNNNELTLIKEIQKLISKNRNDKIKLNKLIALQVQYFKLEKLKQIGGIDYEKYLLGLNRIDYELEYKVKKI